uniref:Uncharacterized protein n=1 Tax=Solanum tuberosum TaxID=4113 RepID=M1DB23_SOLTU
MRAAVAGSMRLKVVNKPLNDFIMHFLTFRAKERTQATPTLFSPFLRLKMVNSRFNDVRPVAPVNALAEKSAARGRGRGRSIG